MGTAGPVRPHRELRRYYGDDSERPRYVRSLFDAAAPHYDWINEVMSLGWGQSYRRIALRKAGLKPGMCVLDIATGTGLVAREVVRVVGPAGSVIGLDPSAGMLRECAKTVPILVMQGYGEALALVGGCFDFVSLGYGLRHVADLSLLFAECFRVLKPSGRLLILEFTRPQSRMALWLWRLYLQKIIPAVTRICTRSESAETVMRYCWDTVEESVPGHLVLDAMSGAGFEKVCRQQVLGIFAEYSAGKPA